MNWRFWKPKHTVESVAQRLALGLRNGSIILDEPFADEPFDDDIETDDVVLQINVAEGTPDAAILEMVKQCANSADLENRNHGGNGLRIGKVVVEFPKVKVALRPRSETERTSAV
jgi:hypothetical protein